MTEAALPLSIREPTGPLQRCRVKQVIILAATFTAGFACGFSAANPKLSTPTASSLWLPRPCGPDDATTTSTESPKLEITPHAWHASSSLPHSTTSTHSTTRAKMGSTSTTLPSSETIIVKVFAGGNGRLGNNIGQLLHGLAFARRIHADKVQLVASGGQLPQVMELKLGFTIVFPSPKSQEVALLAEDETTKERFIIRSPRCWNAAGRYPQGMQ